MVGTKLLEGSLLLGPEAAISNREGEKLVKFGERLLLLFRSQNRIDLFAPLGIEQFDPRFG